MTLASIPGPIGSLFRGTPERYAAVFGGLLRVQLYTTDAHGNEHSPDDGKFTSQGGGEGEKAKAKKAKARPKNAKKLDREATAKATDLGRQSIEADRAGNKEKASQLRVASALYHAAAGKHEDGEHEAADILKGYAEEYASGKRKVGAAHPEEPDKPPVALNDDGRKPGEHGVVAKKKQQHEITLKEHIRDQRRIAGYDDDDTKKKFREAAEQLVKVAPKLTDASRNTVTLEKLLDTASVERSRQPADLEKIADDARRPQAVRDAIKAYLKARDPMHHFLNHNASTFHAGAVESALKAGHHVPADVLDDYPDLAAKYRRSGHTQIKDPAGPQRDDPGRQVRDVQPSHAVLGGLLGVQRYADAAGHEHVPSGPHGGEFTSKGGGKADRADSKPDTAAKPAHALKPEAEPAAPKPHKDAYRETIAQAKAIRRAAWNEARAKAKDADAAADKERENIHEASNNLSWISGDDAFDAYRELDDLITEFDPDWTVADRMTVFKQIGDVAKQALKVEADDSDDPERPTPEDIEANKPKLEAILAHVKAARESLRQFVAARREVQAIKSGKWQQYAAVLGGLGVAGLGMVGSDHLDDVRDESD